MLSPIPSMYGIFHYMYHKKTTKCGEIYQSHGWYGSSISVNDWPPGIKQKNHVLDFLPGRKTTPSTAVKVQRRGEENSQRRNRVPCSFHLSLLHLPPQNIGWSVWWDKTSRCFSEPRSEKHLHTFGFWRFFGWSSIREPEVGPNMVHQSIHRSRGQKVACPKSVFPSFLAKNETRNVMVLYVLRCFVIFVLVVAGSFSNT